MKAKRVMCLMVLTGCILLTGRAAYCQTEPPPPPEYYSSRPVPYRHPQSELRSGLVYPQGNVPPIIKPMDLLPSPTRGNVASPPSPADFGDPRFGAGKRDKIYSSPRFDFPAEMMHHRPLMVWRTFAELPLPPVRTFLFLLFSDLLICLSFRHRTQIASSHSRSKFWKSLGFGAIVLILGALCSRLCSETFILRPLASVLLGLLQFFCLAGVAVSSRALGSSLLSKLRILKADTITERPIRSLIASVLVGTLIISALAILPGLGSLPRLGARLLILFSMLGLGAIFSTRFGKKVD